MRISRSRTAAKLQPPRAQPPPETPPLVTDALNDLLPDASPEATPEPDDKIQQPRLWRDNGWTASVIKNEDDDGWAVAMTKDGASEPALVGPWTMGRDKKNPKPLDGNAFSTLVKTATEFVRRSEQQLHAQLHQHIVVTVGDARITVMLDIVPDDEHPHATLTALDEGGDPLAQVNVSPGFKLNRASATAWAEQGYPKPR